MLKLALQFVFLNIKNHFMAFLKIFYPIFWPDFTLAQQCGFLFFVSNWRWVLRLEFLFLIGMYLHILKDPLYIYAIASQLIDPLTILQFNLTRLVFTSS